MLGLSVRSNLVPTKLGCSDYRSGCSVPGRDKYLPKKISLFDKEKAYFKAVNNRKSILEDMKIFFVWYF